EHPLGRDGPGEDREVVDPSQMRRSGAGDRLVYGTEDGVRKDRGGWRADRQPDHAELLKTFEDDTDGPYGRAATELRQPSRHDRGRHRRVARPDVGEDHRSGPPFQEVACSSAGAGSRGTDVTGNEERRSAGNRAEALR